MLVNCVHPLFTVTSRDDEHLCIRFSFRFRRENYYISTKPSDVGERRRTHGRQPCRIRFRSNVLTSVFCASLISTEREAVGAVVGTDSDV